MTNRLPRHMCASSGTLSLRHHGAPRPVGSIEWRAAPATALMGAPAGLAGEDDIVEAVKGARTCAVDKGSVAHEGDVVEAKVPDGSVCHAVGAESHHGTDYRTSEDIVLLYNVSFSLLLFGVVEMRGKKDLPSCGIRQW
jgi:hypothetical protein